MEKKKPKQLYRKLFCTYTAIVCVIVVALTVYFLAVIRKNALSDREREAQKIGWEVREYIKDKEEASDFLLEELYRKSELIQDMLLYLSLEPDEYQQHKLELFAASNSSRYQGTQLFVRDAFEKYPEMEKIETLSYGDSTLSVFYPRDIVYSYRDGADRAEEIRKGEPAPQNQLCFVKGLRDPNTMEEKGCIIFYFRCAEYFAGRLKGQEYADVAVLEDGRVIYESEAALGEGLVKKEDAGGILDAYSVFREREGKYEVCTLVDRAKASAVPLVKLWAALGTGFLILAGGVLCINAYVRRLTGRVERIVQGMRQVKEGDLGVNLPVNKKGDELDMIASGFNDMCRDLGTYIQKNYLAEIEKKNATLQALQSQINPHFLYNTLEAIRMKAICNGDREVGKMLYSMSVLFRSQLKEDDWITIGQELDYCKQYLGLFEYRYQNIFHYDISCPVELLGTKVIKFILQPVVENYFIHGIRRESKDNNIQITVEQQEENVIFRIADNGTGMEKEALERKNAEFESAEYFRSGKQSLGLGNVNRRIKDVYGPGFGVRLNGERTVGTEVIVKVELVEEAPKEVQRKG